MGKERENPVQGGVLQHNEPPQLRTA